jgi:hypothetical protein
MTDTPIEATADQSAAAAKLTIAGNPMSVADAQQTVRGSGTWFWWIAALSVVNSLAVILDLKYGMALGLGFTSIIDALFSFGADGEAVLPGVSSRLVQLALVGAVAAGFYALGRAARHYSAAAFLWGMGLYALDAAIFALARDWIGVGFHAFVLFMLWGGYSILRSAQRQAPAEFAASARG